MRALSREDILAPRPVKTLAVPTPAWGEDTCVYVRLLSVSERGKFAEIIKDHAGEMHIRCLLLFCTDEVGKPLFTDADATRLAQEHFAVVDDIVAKGIEFNGFGRQAVDDAKKN